MTSPASAVSRRHHASNRSSPEYKYPAKSRRTSPSEHISKRRQISQEHASVVARPRTANARSPPAYLWPAERRNSPPTEHIPQRHQFSHGSDVIFPNKSHHSDLSWRGPPPSEEERPEKSASGEERRRGQRLFGNLSNVLSRNQTTIAQKSREGRREHIDKRQQAKLKANTFSWESDSERKRRTERREIIEDTGKAFLERDAVGSSPFFSVLPARLRDGDAEIIRDQIEYAERTNAAEYDAFTKKYPLQLFENVEFEAGILNGDISPPREQLEPVTDHGTASVPKTEPKDPYESATLNGRKYGE
ncbi:hypothetical protein N7486_006743 [Penicillium sp. IBT 16267x]|nr:hypothetical protein N7486_006743 [Penicillium sp. IBT 16267x]